MTRYVGLLRGVNLGSHTMKMDRLRAVVAGLGHAEVETFIASGNVIFTAAGRAADLEAALEDALQGEFGFAVPTMLRTTKDVAAVASRDPFELPNLYVAFAKTKPTAAAARRLGELQSDDNQLKVVGREVYWGTRATLSQSALSPAKIEKALDQPATLRSISSLRKLTAKHPPG
jgi:uncharacterized protein (DUF1697 family)